MLADFPGHHEKYYPADQHDSSSDPFLPDTHRHVCAKITADERAARHQERVLPNNISGHGKDHHRDRVDADAEEVLDAVGAVQFVEAEQAHRREHKNAVAGAEVAAIRRGEKLKDDSAGPPETHRLLVDRSEMQSLVNDAVRHEEQCREQDQEWDKLREDF